MDTSWAETEEEIEEIDDGRCRAVSEIINGYVDVEFVGERIVKNNVVKK